MEGPIYVKIVYPQSCQKSGMLDNYASVPRLENLLTKFYILEGVFCTAAFLGQV